MTDSNFVPFWLPAGLYCGVLFLSRYKNWWIVILFALLANLTFDLLDGKAIWLSLFFSFANTVDAIVGVYVFRKWFSNAPNVNDVRSIFKFLLINVLFTPILSATIASSVLFFFFQKAFFSTWFIWWSGTALGIILITPLVLSLRRLKIAKIDKRRIPEFIFMLSIVIITTYFIFSGRAGNFLAQKYFIIVVLVWSVFRFGVYGTAITNLVMALTVIFSLTDWSMAFLWHYKAEVSNQIISVQLYIGILSFTSLFASSVISERNKAFKALNQSEHKFKIIFDNAADIILIHDFDGYIVDVNLLASKSLGYSTREMIHIPYFELEIEKNRMFHQQRVDLLTTQKQMIFETVFVTKNKKEIPVEINSKVVRYKHKSMVLSIVRDITERKKNEKELIRAKEKAEESDKLKTTFLANISHEIRTPLNAILGFAQLLDSPSLIQEKRIKYTKVIQERGNDLLNLISDLLDISKIDTGQMEVKQSKMNMNELFNDLIRYFESLAMSKSLTFNYRNDLTYELSNIISDPSHVKKILICLLSNAFKFTHEGQIEYGCKLLSNNNLLFFVKDTGIGIAQSDFEIIFKHFRQADDSYISRQYDGAGIGLSIASGLVALLGGNIWLDSELNKGTSFYFTIPYISAKAEEKEEALQESVLHNWKGKNILIVEDDSNNQLFLEETLENTNVNYRVATSAKQALNLINLNSDIHLILMDIRLPDQNGYDLTREIKLMHPSISVIAQTAYASEADRYLALQAGCVDFMVKPIKYKDLLIRIQKIFDEIDKV